MNLNSGKLTQCYCGRELDNIYNNIEKPLKLEPIGTHCTLAHCYNGHAFLTLGTIPELDTPCYASLRDRVDLSGENWLQPEMREFMSQKLKDNNQTYSEHEKKMLEIKRNFHKAISIQKKITRKLNINSHE